MEVGDLVITGAKSSAADIIVKVGGKFVIELQIKSGIHKLSYVQVKKSVVNCSSDFIKVFLW